jgi:hypothetical protein
MLSHEHLKLLLQGVAVVLALHFAKGSMTGQYRNLMAVGLVAVVLVVVNHLFAEYEGVSKDGTKGGKRANFCEDKGNKSYNGCLKKIGLSQDQIITCKTSVGSNMDEYQKCLGGKNAYNYMNDCLAKAEKVYKGCDK